MHFRGSRSLCDRPSELTVALPSAVSCCHPNVEGTLYYRRLWAEELHLRDIVRRRRAHRHGGGTPSQTPAPQQQRSGAGLADRPVDRVTSDAATVTSIPRGKYIGRRVGDPPTDEAGHFIRCPACGGWIDCRDLAQARCPIQWKINRSSPDALKMRPPETVARPHRGLGTRSPDTRTMKMW